MAKIFVSGQIGDMDYVRSVQQAMIVAGHTITHDWTNSETGEKMLSGDKAKFENPEEASRRAVADIKGVIDSDVYIICTDNEERGRGMYVELGAALALNKTMAKPRLFLLGKMAHPSIFYFDPAIVVCKDLQEVIDHVADL